MNMNKYFFTAILSLCLCHSARAVNDTLYFIYDEATAKLTIKSDYDVSTIVPFVLFDNQNEVSKRIVSGNSTETYRQLNPDSGKGSSMIFENAVWFDTIQCKELDIRAYRTGTDYNKIDKCKRFEIVYRIIPRKVVNEAQDSYKSTKDKKATPAMNRTVIAGSATLLILIFILVLVKRNKKKHKTSICPQKPSEPLSTQKNDASEPINDKEKDRTYTHIHKTRYSVTLDHIKHNIQDYFVMDMQKDFADTSVCKIYLHHKAVKKMYDFFKQSIEDDGITNETGCYFVGCWEYEDTRQSSYNISIEDIVEPGDDIEPSEFSFSFGLQIGVMLYAKNKQLSDETGREYVHTVWMHSHPGLGLFLSSHDLLVQRQIVNPDHPKRMVAFVIDTNTPEFQLAVFTPKNNGEMNNNDDLSHLYSLEELYKWSRKAHASENSSSQPFPTHTPTMNDEPELSVDEEAFFTITERDTSHHKIWFSGRSINAIDDIMYEHADKHIVGGYMLGKTDRTGNLLIDDCKPIKDATEIPEDILGLLIIDSTATDDDIKAYTSNNDASYVILCYGDNDIYIIPRTMENKDFKSINKSTHCSMKEMKEWTRRRRIYK